MPAPWVLPPQTEPQQQGRNLDPPLRPQGKSGQTTGRDVDREALNRGPGRRGSRQNSSVTRTSEAQSEAAADGVLQPPLHEQRLNKQGHKCGGKAKQPRIRQDSHPEP